MTTQNGTKLSKELKPVFRALTAALGSRLTSKTDLNHCKPKLSPTKELTVGPKFSKGVRSDFIRLYTLKTETHTVSLGFSFKENTEETEIDVVKVSLKGFNHLTQRLFFKQLGMFGKEEFTRRINKIISHEKFSSCSNNRIAALFRENFRPEDSEKVYKTKS